ncbi:helicase [Methylonatrum kenyense]|uniref:helicase-related protein n=1 Tax=Methylonatrum kenyense TaxID=455253 RepID=UPI0020C0488E|nr:helicase-related protein [Methylonatrum kenyense]MCK8514980.1 helicase [Methylonatrum kenyense]
MMERPDPEAVMRPLKSFQRRTVEHAFDRLFTAPDSSGRFLVADEVGLGKTLVARGVIARALDYLWDETDRIDIVYICSNQSIARANLPKLQVTGQSANTRALATRLTMLASELAPVPGQPGLADGRVNFVSFTPATSFSMGQSSGMWRERRLLFHLLLPVCERRTGLMNLLQGNVGRGRWREAVKQPVPLEPQIADRFRQRLAESVALVQSLNDCIERYFLSVRDYYPPEARVQRNALISELRQLLAEVCVEALQPDLVILDEFQRFKELLSPDVAENDPAAELAQALFQARNGAGDPVRTLLLSATPYKLFTADLELSEEDHYADFLATSDFLLGHVPERLDSLSTSLSRFSRELKRAASGQPNGIEAARREAEIELRRIMARTERVDASDERDGMVADRSPSLDLQVEDVQQYLAADAWFRAVGDQDPMVYWKAAPYLPHFMQSYRVNQRVTETLELSPDRLAKVLERHNGAFLNRGALARWASLAPQNAKLRTLVSDLLDTGLWKLLWMPPSIPYWDLGGPYAGQEKRTKTLLFSAWNVVPDVVSAVLSYEAERRMMGGRLASYDEPSRQRPPLLRLTDHEGTRSRHRLLLLLFPCVTLADEAHPLRAPAGEDRRQWVRSRVADLLQKAAQSVSPEAPVDNRWEYLAPLIIDSGLGRFLDQWRDKKDDQVGRPNPDTFPRYMQDLKLEMDLERNPLGRQPDGLVDLMTDVALGAPGVIATRTLGSAGLPDDERRARATQLAQAFWNLFNRPAVISLLEGLYGSGTEQEEGVYWRRVLAYCEDGNLQAVIDEAWHLLWEQHAWSEQADPGEVAMQCVQGLSSCIEPRPSRVHVQFFEKESASNINVEELRVRATLAQRFGATRGEEGVVTQDSLRKAFNSPFRPFVLTSTSVGQEGLDFHPWCHQLVHWNLPGNPVDMEQREGRIHRYKGHAVRRNVAARFCDAALTSWALKDDLWARLFVIADDDARQRAVSDLVPFWISPGPHKVERHVPTLPFTQEVEAFRRLKHQLAAYRVVFGQPRQEELLSLLERSDIPTETLQRWTIRLAPV